MKEGHSYMKACSMQCAIESAKRFVSVYTVNYWMPCSQRRRHKTIMLIYSNIWAAQILSAVI